MIARRRLLGELAVLSGLVLLLALLGPFGSFAAPLSHRLVLWALYLFTGYAFFRPVIAGSGALARQTGLPAVAATAAACALAAFPTSMVIVLLSAGSAWRTVSGSALANAYVQTLIVGATVTVVQLLARPERAADAEVDAPPASLPNPAPLVALPEPVDSNEGPALLNLLPPHLRGDILCLENEDHYLRVHTQHGSAMILMRMRDAVDQLQGKGERVHRSWWVAKDAVVATVRQGRNLALRLSDGREVPVARANVAALRARGWLAELPGDS